MPVGSSGFALQKEPTFHLGRRRPFANRCGIGPLPYQQLQRGQEGGLARTGLARNDGQPLARTEVGVFDEGYVSNMQFIKHGPRPLKHDHAEEGGGKRNRASRARKAFLRNHSICLAMPACPKAAHLPEPSENPTIACPPAQALS